MEYRTVRDPNPDEVKFVDDALRAFNDKIVGPDNHQELNLVKYDGNGHIVAGLLGGTYWGWLHVSILWVAEGHRRGGLGRQLMAEAEAMARDRGCGHAHVDTMSFQALPFYQKLGYEICGVVDDIPVGHKKYHLAKTLAGAHTQSAFHERAGLP
jgi:GNAT superfamily N-acetyltransferase